MRLVEEVYVKTEKDLICQSCGCDIPEGSNHLLESYVHKGKISTSHYCLKKKCNPPNNVRLRLFWGSIIVGLASWVIYLSFFNWEFLGVSQNSKGGEPTPYTPRHGQVDSNSWKAESFHFLNLIMSW